MTKLELFQARAYAKHWPSWKIWFLLTWVSVHGNVHQLKRLVIDIQMGVEGSLCPLSLSPHSPTVSFLSRQTVLWKMAYTLHISLYEEMTVFYSICTTTDWSSDPWWFSFYLCSSLHQKQRKPQEIAACISRKYNYLTGSPICTTQKTLVQALALLMRVVISSRECSLSVALQQKPEDDRLFRLTGKC